MCWNNVKIKVLLLEISIFVLLGLVVGRAVYHVIQPGYSWFSDEANSDSCGVSDHKEHIVGMQSGYNFLTMIDLVEAAKRLKRKARGSFFSLRKNLIKIDLDSEEIHIFLRQLETERNKFNDYVWDLKGREKSSLTAKQDRSLLYYMHVLEAAIIDVRDLIKSAQQKKRANPES